MYMFPSICISLPSVFVQPLSSLVTYIFPPANSSDLITSTTAVIGYESPPTTTTAIMGYCIIFITIATIGYAYDFLAPAAVTNGSGILVPTTAVNDWLHAMG